MNQTNNQTPAKLDQPIRVVTASALFDGHDASINMFRRLLQQRGLEVIHLGHNRSVKEVVRAALEEDADAVLVSSYQGGHNEYFSYLVDLLQEQGAGHIQIFGGGGGVILPSEIEALEKKGVARLYHAETGKQIGIHGIIEDIVAKIQERQKQKQPLALLEQVALDSLSPQKPYDLARYLSLLENHSQEAPIQALRQKLAQTQAPRTTVLGITGTGGSGKSSITDELVHRFLKLSPDLRLAVLAVDPSKSSTGGALLGDRIRMNAIDDPRVFMRSFATRDSKSELSLAMTDAVNLCRLAGFDLVIAETSGIGQGDNLITNISDLSIYAMTSEFGAPSQLEKIDMLDLADFTVLNKMKKPGSEDALREITTRYLRSKEIKANLSGRQGLFDLELPIYATEAAEFNNPGINKLAKDILAKIAPEKKQFQVDQAMVELLPTAGHKDFTRIRGVSDHYLSDIADKVEDYHRRTEKEAQKATQAFSAQTTWKLLQDQCAEASLTQRVEALYQEQWNSLSQDSRDFLSQWPQLKESYQQEVVSYYVRGKEIKVAGQRETLCRNFVPKVALPNFTSWGELIRFRYRENLPGYHPYTAGVFPFKRTNEDPKRMFAGEGSPARTNKRFHFLTKGEASKRLSTAFDGVTLYGENPATSPDVYGKVGDSGVSICTVEDLQTLYSGFDLCDPSTSVSMTINGPAPIMLAMYFVTALRQQEEKAGRKLSPEEKIQVFRNLRGTVQADILKEDQGQNTCLFSLDFALKMMGDVQLFFAQKQIKNYYTISISGYHIAEAGANPISQLAFTLANGFHYVEYFKSLGIEVDDFAENFSFFFSNGLDPEYTVIGRVARRIWAIVMKEKYGASERVQKLKYHIQTSGRSLHAHEIDFNDIRTTLQALLAFNDNCNSLHTNSYDEAITTPTEESVRRSMAIQLILTKEFGLLKNENPNQGAFIIEELTDLVEKAVLQEFRNISYRGGVLGAMEKQYQRSKIQEESLYYEELKHSGEYPIVGVNCYENKNEDHSYFDNIQVQRAEPEEKESQLQRLAAFEDKNREASQQALLKLQAVALKGGNIFEELLNAVEVCSLGQISRLLYQVGGKYRRNL